MVGIVKPCGIIDQVEGCKNLMDRTGSGNASHNAVLRNEKTSTMPRFSAKVMLETIK